MENFLKRVSAAQLALKAPKSQYNSFGKYKYRNCEDILEAAKPICAANGMVLTLSDDIVEIGGRFYVKATATLLDTESAEEISNTALARESSEKKGMDESQITGTASSYARKYALNGLFCIDDTKDADTDEYTSQNQSETTADAQRRSDTPRKYICEICGGEITGYAVKGEQFAPERQARETKEEFGHELCRNCRKKLYNERNANAAAHFDNVMKAETQSLAKDVYDSIRN